MTVSSETAKVTYTGDASTTTFAYTFPILDETHLLVQIKDTNDAITTKVITTDYTVTGTGNEVGSTDYLSGNVVFGAGDIPAATDTVIIKRNVPLKQQTDYTENSTFPAESHEDALDRLTMIAQQIDEQVDLAVKVDSAVTGFDATLPTPEADKYIGFNGSATGLITKTVQQLGTITVPVGISDGGTGSTTAAAAAEALGVGVTDSPTFADVTLTGDLNLADAKGVKDGNDNEFLIFQETPSATNHYELTNSATGNSPLFKAVGSDTNVDARIASQGTSGDVRLESGSGVSILAGTAASAAEVRLGEDTDNGTNYMGFKSPAAVTTSTTLTLPDGDGAANQSLVTNASGTLSWSHAPATQAEQETGSSTTVMVTPGRQQYHDSAAKCWAKVTGTGTASLDGAYNLSSLVDNGTGSYTLTIDTDFSGTSEYVWASMTIASGFTFGVITGASNAGSVTIDTFNTSNTATDTIFSVVGFGDQ